MKWILVLGVPGHSVEFVSNQHIGRDLRVGEEFALHVPQSKGADLLVETRITRILTFELRSAVFHPAALLRVSMPMRPNGFADDLRQALRRGPDSEKWQWLFLYREHLPPDWLESK